MSNPSPRYRSLRLAVAVIAALVIVLSWWQVLSVGRGLVVRDWVAEDGTPLRYIVPEGASDAPGVVIAHGFAGSKQLMYGFAYDIARAGYGVMLLDFDGHGTGRGRLDRGGDALQRNLATAHEALVAQAEIDPARIALLGHSMGSGAVMTAAVDSPDQYDATVAVSPTDAAVSADNPRNLLLMAGTLEPQFLDNARDLQARAGGSNDELSAGAGRSLVEVPNVEHITILFSRLSRRAALDWLNQTFDLPAVEVAPDRRMIWFGGHLAAWLVLFVAVMPFLSPGTPAGTPRRKRWHWLGLPVGAVAAAAVLFLAGNLFDTSSLGGLLVGGALGLWFLVMGLVWLPVGFRTPRPVAGDLAWGVGLFLFLSLAFGAMSQVTWLPWLLTPERLARWPFLAAATLPWLLASALAQHGARPAARFGWWVLQSAVLVAGLGLTIVLSPSLFFVALLLPIFPIILGVMAVAGAAVDRPWAVALGSALFLGWILVAVFPLA